MENETLSQKALRLLSAIPSEDFITGSFTDYKGKCCAIGHYTRLTSDDPTNYSVSNCDDYFTTNGRDLRNLSSEFILNKHQETGSIAYVNNEDTINGYNEPVIKDRVIHLLTDMVAEGL